MKSVYIYYLLFLNFYISANPVEEINTFFENDLTFIQTSLNKIDNTLDKSTGSFKRESDNSIRVEIESPFNEIYFINSNGIEIHDLEFNQIRNIPNEQVRQNFFVNFILNGFIDHTKITDQKVKSFIVYEAEREYYFELINQDTLQIKFKDNMDIDNLIKFFKNNAS